MSGITLVQLASLETEPLRKAVLVNLIREVPIFNYIPFTSISSLRAVGVRWSKLPTGGTWRQLNGSYSSGEEGTVENVEESLFGFGGEITFDRVIEKTNNYVTDPIRLQIEMKLKVLAYQYKDAFINGDHASDVNSIEGLKKRISNLPSRQYVRADGTGASAALDPLASVANARKWYDGLEKAFKRCNDGMVDLMLANEETYLGFGRIFRYMQSGGSYLSTTTDVLGREFVTFKGKPIMDMGLKYDQSTEIIGNSETADDGGTDATSIYFASFDEMQGLSGVEVEPLQIYDPLNGAESPSAPQKMRRIDWWNGLFMAGSYGLVRYTNFESATNW